MFGDLDDMLDSFVFWLHTGVGNLAEPRKLGRKWDGCLVVTMVIVDGAHKLRCWADLLRWSVTWWCVLVVRASLAN